MNADCFVVDVPFMILHGKHDLSPLEQTVFCVVKMRVDFDIIATPECFRVNLILVNRSEMCPRIFSVSKQRNHCITYNHILFKEPFPILEHGIAIAEPLVYALLGHPAIE